MTIMMGYTSANLAANVCPARPGQPLRYVDVFDGAANEGATLIPEETTETRGYWDLAYVYDQGRFVTLRCKYADEYAQDVMLKRVGKCSYQVSSDSLKLNCR